MIYFPLLSPSSLDHQRSGLAMLVPISHYAATVLFLAASVLLISARVTFVCCHLNLTLCLPHVLSCDTCLYVVLGLSGAHFVG